MLASHLTERVRHKQLTLPFRQVQQRMSFHLPNGFPETGSPPIFPHAAQANTDELGTHHAEGNFFQLEAAILTD
ncbi:MAG: hypothetical protein AB1898_29515 [Acidobacteriota bacterium]